MTPDNAITTIRTIAHGLGADPLNSERQAALLHACNVINDAIKARTCHTPNPQPLHRGAGPDQGRCRHCILDLEN